MPGLSVVDKFYCQSSRKCSTLVLDINSSEDSLVRLHKHDLWPHRFYKPYKDCEKLLMHKSEYNAIKFLCLQGRCYTVGSITQMMCVCKK